MIKTKGKRKREGGIKWINKKNVMRSRKYMRSRKFMRRREDVN